MAKKERRGCSPTPLLYWERPKERPIWGGCPRRPRRRDPPRLGRSRCDSSRSTSGPDRRVGNACRKTATPAIPSARDGPSAYRRWGNVFSSSETPGHDLAFFASVLPSDFALGAALPFVSAALAVSPVPDVPPLSSALAVS